MAKMNSAQRRAFAAILSPIDSMIVESFQSETYVQNKVDVQNEPLYDTFMIAPGGGVINEGTSALFTTVGPGSGKSPGQTNLTQSRRLPAPEAFSVLGIRLYWNEDAAIADLLAIAGTTVAALAFQFFLGKKSYNMGPLWYYAAGGGFVNTNPVPALGLYTNGVADRNAMHKLAIPLVIENQGEFYANLTGPQYPVTAAFQLMCLLDGLHARGVQ
jgi:hypothetical protein